MGKQISRTLAIGLTTLAMLFVTPGVAHAASWNTETLDPLSGVGAGVGQHNAVALFRGLPHVWYYDAADHALRHAWYTGSGWAYENVDGTSGSICAGHVTDDVGQHSAVTLIGGLPHVWYYDATAQSLRHAWWNGASWNCETLDGTGGRPGSSTDQVGQYNAVALFRGLPHVWYYDATGTGTLRHAWWNGASWNFETLDGAGGTAGQVATNVGQHSAVTLIGGLPHVWYYDVANSHVRHAWYARGRWNFETLDAGTSGGQYISVLIYGRQPHVWYYADVLKGLRHIWYG